MIFSEKFYIGYRDIDSNLNQVCMQPKQEKDLKLQKQRGY